MNLKDVHNIYFIGIGGIGMSALARYFKFVNKNVSGYDKTETPLVNELMALGIPVHFEDDLNSISNEFKNAEHTLVVYTPAVPKDFGELRFFLDGGFAVKKRSEVLGMITQDTFCFAVAGTHGKTTTSSILAHLLNETDMPLIALLGGISEDLNSNFLLRGTEYSVVEADEYDRSFLQLAPDVACITSMDADHLDIYGDAAELTKSFKAFAAKIKPNGKLFVRKGLPLLGISYGIEDGSDYCINNIRIEQGSYVFDLKTPQGIVGNVRFNKPGKHNLLNGLAAFAMAAQIVPKHYRLAEALASFKGVQRRFSYQIKEKDFIFIDDYAHHPTEIEAVYQAVTEMHPNKKTMVVFQPHLYSRTRDFIKGFASSLAKFDHILLLDIYPARETPIKGVDSSWLLGKIDNPNKKLVQREKIIDEINNCQPEVLITMGAGDIGLEVKNLKKQLAYAD
ncbi:UDP-N-acetylmuramate--L-alanine ligase [Croceitalea sp. MTPC5]|uniref:UDP-N-acetylmuramate--L-alanine ligase n=1 Tax=Croceitalea sp. MTPC5 TaxID=3056565 RepID=UPI002B3E24ED|nr:UDP-N-acetylmuramate--L-alanine ligase [Croceitalea sp. MTPC5]